MKLHLSMRLLRPALRWSIGSLLLTAWLSLCATPCTGAALDEFDSKHYTVRTNGSRTSAAEFAKHMDGVFDEYARRFRTFGKQHGERMPLYLFKTQDDYLAFMKKHGIDASATGGIFFIRPDLRGLATWIDDRPQWITLETIQHEGFHQFAYAHIGTRLPLWANEGLAEYFGDGILVGGKLRVGISNGRRIEAVKNAIADRKIIDFDTLMNMQQGQWHLNLVRDRESARLQYDQAWSMIYFLIHGEDGRYREAFEKYLSLVAKGSQSKEAFKTAFGAADTATFRRQWELFASRMEPDALDTAVSRMRFLAQGLLVLQERREPAPMSTNELRQRLTALGFRASRIENGIRTEVSANDASLYMFQKDNGSHGTFEILSPQQASHPPRVTATGLSPQPVLIWTRDASGQLMPEVSFKE